MDEILDLVNSDDQIIGTISRITAHAQNITNFRAVYSFIENLDGKLWIGLRPANKQVHPSTLDLGVAGHVSSGEEYEETVIREVAEEIGISVALSDYQYLGHLTPHKHNMPAFGKVFRLRTNLTPNYTSADFVKHFWLNPHDILDHCKTHSYKIKPDWQIILNTFYYQK